MSCLQEILNRGSYVLGAELLADYCCYALMALVGVGIWWSFGKEIILISLDIT
ncbi:MAG: hypothetical protein JRI72_11030 [Deltaproteobacteria bacterium]|nr:hypothetical protein [Deltaproteobacteria bacterium]